MGHAARYGKEMPTEAEVGEDELEHVDTTWRSISRDIDGQKQEQEQGQQEIEQLADDIPVGPTDKQLAD
jgi:hypothetical protein